MKILVSPAHYALGPKLQSEFYLAHKVLEGLAQSNSELDLHILCCHYYEKNSLPKNCHIYEMIPGDNNPEITTPTRIRFYLWIFIKSIQVCRKNQIDLLWHFLPNGPYSFNLFIFFNFHKLFGIKKTLLGRLASTYEDDKASRNGGDSKISFKSTEVKRSKDKFLFVQNFLYTVSKPFIGYYLGKFQKLIFYNQTSLQFYERKTSSKIPEAQHQIIPVGFDNSQFSFKPKVLGKKLRLLYAGSLNDRKRPQKAILMAKHLNNLKSDYQLDIVGDGYLKEELIKMTKKNELSEKIIFHGSLPKSRIAKFYQKAHFLISFSSAEVFTHTLLESWATGTIFLGSDTPENIEMVGKDYGLIVDPSDGCELKSLAERISQMTQKEFDKIILRSLVESKKYHWPVVIDKYSQLIKELLSP